MAEGTGEAGKLAVFISYSRDDLAFADQLDATLRIIGFDTALDRHGIHAGEKWEPRLGALIRNADTVVFVLTPNSAKSKICEWEVEEAGRLGKRIMPVVPGPLGDAQAPRGLAALNYIFFYDERKKPGSSFGAGLLELVEGLKTDLEWPREHTRLLQRATEWDSGERPVNRLLSGDDIVTAKAWAARSPKDAPAPPALHPDFIKASEAWESRRQSEERQRLEERERLVSEAEANRKSREAAQREALEQARRVAHRTAVGLVVSLVLALAAAGVGWYASMQRQDALMQAARAEASKRETEVQKLALQAANQRLSTDMKLRIAPFGDRAYSIPEHWYKLATTNAASIAFVQGTDVDGRLSAFTTGFVIKGKALYAPWGNADFLVTAWDVFSQVQRIRAYFPAIDHNKRIDLTAPNWASDSINVAIFEIRSELPAGVQAITEVSDIDVMQWGEVNINAARSVLPKSVPLIVLGGALADAEATGETLLKALAKGDPIELQLTLAISNALGRTRTGGTRLNEIVFTDSTTMGSAGSPVFDADTGQLLSMVQFGSPVGEVPKVGLAYSGGVALSEVKREINKLEGKSPPR